MIDCLFIFLFRVRFFIHGQTVDAHQHRISLVEHTKLYKQRFLSASLHRPSSRGLSLQRENVL